MQDTPFGNLSKNKIRKHKLLILRIRKGGQLENIIQMRIIITIVTKTVDYLP